MYRLTPPSPRRPRIMLLIRNLSGGGAELVVESLFTEFDREILDVSVCELHGHGEKAIALAEAGHTQIFSLNPTGGRLSVPARLSRLWRLVRTQQIDLLHSHSTDALADAAACRLLVPRVRLVHTFHFGNYPHHAPTHLRLERIFHRFADQLVAVGFGQADAIARTYGIERSRIHVIWNGIKVRDGQVDHGLLSPYVGSGKVLIGTIGTLIPQKGHADLIAVAAEIKRLGLPALFLVVGWGPLHGELAAAVRDHGLADTVVFMGWVKDAATTVLPGLDIFFQPSKWEAMSMVLLEAAVAGKAIVCTSVGEARNVITHGRTGFIVAPGDIASMTQALATLVRDRELRDALGSAARQDVLRRFTADQMVLQYTDLYRGILGIEATRRN